MPVAVRGLVLVRGGVVVAVWTVVLVAGMWLVPRTLQDVLTALVPELLPKPPEPIP